MDSDSDDNEEKWPGDSLPHRVMRLWEKRRESMIHDYSLVGYLLSPNPKIMDDAVHSKSPQHSNAAKRLIVKLILDRTCLG